MPKYLLEVNYTLDGVQGVKSEGGSARVAAAKALIKGLGGRVESFYFAFGGTDVYVIADMPDNVSVAAAALAVSAGGGATSRTVVLLTAAEVDAAVAKKTTYRPPGSGRSARPVTKRGSRARPEAL
jgi:uncharacterized protein with GYD domain